MITSQSGQTTKQEFETWLHSELLPGWIVCPQENLFSGRCILFAVISTSSHNTKSHKFVLHCIAEPVSFYSLTHGHPGLQSGLVLGSMTEVEGSEVQHRGEVIDYQLHVIPVSIGKEGQDPHEVMM